MADGYWGRYTAPLPLESAAKRPRADYELPPGGDRGQESYDYLPRDDTRAGFYGVKDTKLIEESNESYLQNAQRGLYSRGDASNISGVMPNLRYGEASNIGGSGISKGVGGIPDLGEGMPNLRYGDLGMTGGPGPRAVGPDMISSGRGMGYGSELPMEPMARQGPPVWEMPLPPDASNTIFVEGIPRGITQREVAHIFRPFLGYKEVRIITKEPKYHSADPTILCFVDFTNAAYTMRVISALQGYKMDEKDPESPVLRLQFSRYPGPRSSHGSRGRR